MKNFILSIAILIGLGAQAKADETAIQAVISSQIEAFLADDFTTAFTYASPTIKNIFRTPERFGTMVREGYPMVWRPAEVNFLAMEERGGRLFQTVMMRDGAGALHVLEYEMIETPEGWQIDGVRMIRDNGGTA